MIVIGIILLIWTIESRGGIDFNQAFTDGTFSCFVQNGVTFAIIQAYQSYGGINTNSVQNLKTAKNRGLSTDIFMNSCTAKDPSFQVNQMINSIPESLYEKVWIRVESNTSPGCSWLSNTPEKNCQYLKNLITAIQNRGKDVGIYSSYQFWNLTFQNPAGCPDVADLPLWYEADDGQAKFTNFYSFGGWKTPYMKSFNVGFQLCGTSINLDYRPS